MLRSQTNCCVVLFLLFSLGWAADAQSNSSSGETSSTYTLRLPVDEVVLTFNAVDANGLPINDLKAGRSGCRTTVAHHEGLLRLISW